MNALLNKVKKYLPINDVLSFIFKTALSSYIITKDVDVNSLEKEISTKSFFSLVNLRFNTANINSSFLSTSPIKVLDGTVSKLSASLVESKLEIVISGINLLLMPFFEKPAPIKNQNSNKSNSTNNVKENKKGILDTVLNLIMMKINIVVENINIKILTYEPKENTLNNPTIALYLGRLEIGKEEKDYDNYNMDEKNDNEKLFLDRMKIKLWNFCITIEKKSNFDDADVFFDINTKYIKDRENNDKLMFNFFCKNNTILAMDYVSGPSLEINFKCEDILNIDVKVAKTEIIITPIQFHNLVIFSHICGLIYQSDPDSHGDISQKKNNNSDQEKGNNGSINLFGFNMKEQKVKVDFIGLSTILYLKNNLDEMPKLFTFFADKSTNQNNEKHFCYYEDDFFYFYCGHIEILQENYNDSKKTFSHTSIVVECVNGKYVNYLDKEENKKSFTTKKSINFKNSKIVTSISKLGESLYQSTNSLEDSSVFHSMIEDDTSLVDNYTKMLNYNFQYETINLFMVGTISIDLYNNEENSIINIDIKEIAFDVHLLPYFMLVTLFKSNNLFEKVDCNQKDKPKNIKEQIKQTTNEQYINLNNKSSSVNDNSSSKNKKSQIFIGINSFTMKIYNFTREYSHIDGNEFFFQFYMEYIYKDTLKVPQNLSQFQKKKITIQSTKNNEYIQISIPGINILYSSSKKESEILCNIQDLKLNYKYYQIAYFQQPEFSSIIINPHKSIRQPKEFITGIAAPIKKEDFLFYDVDLEALSNKNEMKLRNKILQIKMKQNKILLDLTITKEIQMNIETSIISDLLKYNENFFIGFNLFQIYFYYINSVYNENVRNLLQFCGISNATNNKPLNNETIEESKIIIKGEISSILLSFNKNNTVSEYEGNLFKIYIDNTKMNYVITSGNPLNNIEISIEDLRMFIKKNFSNKKEFNNNKSQFKESLLCSGSIIDKKPQKKKNGAAKEESSDEYFMVISHVHRKKDIKDPLLKMNICFQNVKKNRENCIKLCKDNIIEQISLTSNEKSDLFSYEEFLLDHQLPMDNMKLNVIISFNNLYVHSFYNALSEMKETFTSLLENVTTMFIPNDKEEKDKVELIPLCEKRDIEFLMQIQFNKLYHDIFFIPPMIEKKDYMRAIIVIDKIDINNHYNKNQIELSNFYLYYLGNFDYIDNNIQSDLDRYDIRDYLPHISNENSYLRRIGYIEIVFTDKINICNSQKVKEDNPGKETSINELKIKSIDVSICRDTFGYIQTFVHFFTDYYMPHLLSLFPSDKDIQISNEDKKMDSKLEKAKTVQEKSTDFQIIDNFYDNNNKQLNVIQEEDEISNSNLSSTSKDLKTKQIANSFTVVEYNSPKEGDSVYTILIESFRLYLYKGKDFDFDNVHNDISSIEKSFVDKENNPQTIKNILEIDSTYLSNSKLEKNKRIDGKVSRKRKKNRDYNNYLCLITSNINLSYSSFENEQNEKKNILLLKIQKFEIEDNFSGSKYKKMISRFNYEDNKLNFISLSIKQDTFNKTSLFCIDVNLIPVNILIDQISLLFLLKFTSEKGKDLIKEDDKDLVDTFEIYEEGKEIEEPTKLYIQKLEINKFFINFSYNSHELNLNKLKNKDYLEFMNLTNITNLKITLKQYKNNKKTEIGQEIDQLVNFWKEDIIKKQLISAAFHSIAVIRPFTALTEGLIDIIKQPIISYQKEGSVKKGIKKGFKSFFSNFTTQSLFLGEKITRFIFKTIGGKKGISLNKDSYYKKWMYKMDEKKRKYDNYFVKQ